jgi:hypothetical protein
MLGINRGDKFPISVFMFVTYFLTAAMCVIFIPLEIVKLIIKSLMS